MHKGRSTIKISALLSFIMLVFSFATCKYSFKDTSPIPADITTFRVNLFENKARYVNPSIAPQLTEKLRQKIISQTRLRETKNDDANRSEERRVGKECRSRWSQNHKEK